MMPAKRSTSKRSPSKRKSAEAGRHQAGRHQAGRHQAGRHQAGRHQAGRHQAGRHQAGRHQAGRHQAGRHQAGRHQAGRHQAGRHQAGRHQARQEATSSQGRSPQVFGAQAGPEEREAICHQTSGQEAGRCVHAVRSTPAIQQVCPDGPESHTGDPASAEPHDVKRPGPSEAQFLGSPYWQELSQTLAPGEPASSPAHPSSTASDRVSLVRATTEAPSTAPLSAVVHARVLHAQNEGRFVREEAGVDDLSDK